jgi:hypothetical protein
MWPTFSARHSAWRTQTSEPMHRIMKIVGAGREMSHMPQLQQAN